MRQITVEDGCPASQDQHIYYGGFNKPFLITYDKLYDVFFGNFKDIKQPQGDKKYYVVETPKRTTQLTVLVEQKEIVAGPVDIADALFKFENIRFWPNIVKTIEVGLPHLTKFRKLIANQSRAEQIEKKYNYLLCKHIGAYLIGIFPNTSISIRHLDEEKNKDVQSVVVYLDGVLGLYSQNDWLGGVNSRSLAKNIKEFWDDNHTTFYATAIHNHNKEISDSLPFPLVF